MKALTIPQPNFKQLLFLKDKHAVVGFGGARGGGKSWAVRVKAVLLCMKHPGITVCIVRKSYPELIENHIKPLKAMLHVGAQDALARYNDSRKEMTFMNGSVILFKYCDTDKDLSRFQGLQTHILFVDEATQFTEFQIKSIRAIVRSTDNLPRRTYLTCNPGGPGHAFIKRIMVDRKFEDGEDADDYSFIQSLVTDNKALMDSNPEYVKQLESLPSALRSAWLMGDWNSFQGAFFSEFRETPDAVKAYEAGLTVDEAKRQHRWTHVIEPFDIPHDWKVYRSYDWGYGHPFSVGWWAQDYDGVLYRILELYGCTKTANEGVRWSNKQQFDRIAEIEAEHPWLNGRRIQGVADPSIWDGSHGISAAEEAEKHSLWFEPGVNDRIPGWMQVHERLMFDENGFAAMYFFDTCKAAIRTLPLLQYDEHKAEDLDTSMEDHAADEIRYMCMMRPIPPRVVEVEKNILSDPLNQFTTRRYSQSQYSIRR